MKTPPPYPVTSTSQITAHFAGLRAEPPAHLADAWRALVLRRMAGQTVDAEIAALLQREREHNLQPVPAVPPMRSSEGASGKPLRFASRGEGIGAGGRGSVPDREDA